MREPGGLSEPVAVAWQGDFGLPTSLAIINDELVGRLAAGGRFVVQRRDVRGRPLDAAPPWPPEVEVRHQWPPDLRPAEHGRLVLDQPWEFGSIPAAWAQAAAGPVEEVWVPSAFVARMFTDDGVDPGRVHVVAPGIDPARFAAAADAAPPPGAGDVRTFLFVGGPIARKGFDVLLEGWRAAFGPGDPVRLVVKDVGVAGVYRNADRAPLRAAIEDPATAPIEHRTQDLSAEGMAALLASADVLVHPYRGEGFGMPVLEALACGRPVLVTAGGPTDEFVPGDAAWRVPARRTTFARRDVGGIATVSEPWLLEPDLEAVVALLREAARAPADELARRGAAGRRAAASWTWDAAAAAAAARLEALAGAPPRTRAVAEVEADGAGPRVLAAPAWTPAALGALVRAWARVPRAAEATLVVLVQPEERSADEAAAALLAAAAAAGVDLEACADVAVHVQRAGAANDAAVVEAVDAVADDAPPPLRRLAAALGRAVAPVAEAAALRPRR